MSVITIQKVVRGFLVRNKKCLVSSLYQTKNWRYKQRWYKNGRSNECEIYQRNLIDKITGQKCVKTKYRLNFITKELMIYHSPNKQIDGYEWTEDFDGFLKDKDKNMYFNLKFICEAGGTQTRSLREVYHFILLQLEYILKYKSEDIYFINILDGNECFKNMDKFKYLLNKDEFSSVKKYIFVGDMKEFELWFKK
jgi:hypothetical protein